MRFLGVVAEHVRVPAVRASLHIEMLARTVKALLRAALGHSTTPVATATSTLRLALYDEFYWANTLIIAAASKFGLPSSHFNRQMYPEEQFVNAVEAHCGVSILRGRRGSVELARFSATSPNFPQANEIWAVLAKHRQRGACVELDPSELLHERELQSPLHGFFPVVKVVFPRLLQGIQDADMQLSQAVALGIDGIARPLASLAKVLWQSNADPLHVCSVAVEAIKASPLKQASVLVAHEVAVASLLTLLRGSPGLDQLEDSVSVLEQALGRDHPGVLHLLGVAADALFKQGRYQPASCLSSRCVQIAERALGATHLATTNHATRCGQVFLALRQFPAAAAALEKALAGSRAREDAGGVANAAYLLAQAAVAQGDAKRSATLAEEATSIWAAELGDLHPCTLNALHARALALTTLTVEEWRRSEDRHVDGGAAIACHEELYARLAGLAPQDRQEGHEDRLAACVRDVLRLKTLMMTPRALQILQEQKSRREPELHAPISVRDVIHECVEVGSRPSIWHDKLVDSLIVASRGESLRAVVLLSACCSEWL